VGGDDARRADGDRGGAAMTERPVLLRDHLFGFAMVVAYVAILLVTSRDLGMTRDEGFYVDAAESYARWFELVLRHDPNAFERSIIDASWMTNHEHPSLVKGLFALSWLAQQRFDLFPEASMAFRFPGMVLSALVLWIVYVFGVRAFSRRVGLFAAFAYALLPNAFYHAHLDCFDGPIVTMLTLVTYCYWRSLTSRRWLIATGITYGLCLETKHNAWMLPLIFFAHWLFVAGSELARRRRGDRRRISLVPWWILAMGLLGPPIFVALWPWLWHDTQARVAEYVGFHVNHVHYNIQYLGHTYFGPPSPASYPWVMTLFTTPLTVLVIAIVGLAMRFRQLLPPGSYERARIAPSEIDPRRLDVLLFGSFLTPMFVLSMPWTPIFGGTKHFLASFPMLFLFGGHAFDRIVSALAIELRRVRLAKLATPIALATAMLPAAVDTVHSHPFGLSFYAFAAGGVPGGADLGMIRQFWGFTTGSLVPWLNANAPDGARVWICDSVPTAFSMLVRDGRLRSDIGMAWDLSSADYAIVHHEQHFNIVDYQIWEAYGRVDPVYVLTYDGVPIISVYENPARAALRALDVP
jgi:4-amino-4-deoxy-L-arabinose transferase-like glycosyltransferase